jgi:ATP-binding cassette subfamily F protein 3
LNSYEGTVLYVSHDRYFINKTASRIMDLTHNQLFNYIGDYDYYLEKHETTMKAANLSGTLNISGTAVSSGTTGASKTAVGYNAFNTPSSNGAAAKGVETETKLDWKAQKEEQAKQRKRENDLKKCEERITKLEERNAWLDEEMSKPEVATNSVRLQELAAEQNKNLEELESLYELWEELAE